MGHAAEQPAARRIEIEDMVAAVVGTKTIAQIGIRVREGDLVKGRIAACLRGPEQVFEIHEVVDDHRVVEGGIVPAADGAYLRMKAGREGTGALQQYCTVG